MINILGLCPKRLPLQELTNELQNRKIDYENQNKRRKLVEILDKELTNETLENKGNYIYCLQYFTCYEIFLTSFYLGLCLRNCSMSHKEYTTR